jgi:hypothetical protein
MRTIATDINEVASQPPLIAYHKFLDQVGVSRTTGWRWRTKNWLQVITIAGRPYVRREAIHEFLSRAEAGEFAKASNVPRGQTEAVV